MLKSVGQTLDDGRWFTASAERNRDPILAVLKRTLPRTGLVLEIASGTGQHVVHFARTLHEITWQPSDPDGSFRQSIRSWVRLEKLGNVLPPLDLDVGRSSPWPVDHLDALLCINMIHVASWAATEALFTGAKDALIRGGVLFLYGPYRRFGRHTAPSNAPSTLSCAAKIPIGVCVIWKPSSRPPLGPVFSWRRLSACRRTISVLCF